MNPQELVSAFESWCRESQIENTFCTSAKNKLAEMIEELTTRNTRETCSNTPNIKKADENHMHTTTSKVVDEAWENLKASRNETITSRWYFNQGWQAGCVSKEREMLLSRVVGPSEEMFLGVQHKICQSSDYNLERVAKHCFACGHDFYRDNLKLVPLTSEQVEKLLPDLCELNEMLVATIKEVNEYNDKNVSTRNLKSDAEVLLPKLRDFISKRLAGM